MQIHKHSFIAALMCLLFILLCMLPEPALATPPPSSVKIQIVNAPDDLAIFFLVNDEWIEGEFYRLAWETYYTYYGEDFSFDDWDKVHVTAIQVAYDDISYELQLPGTEWGSVYLYTLDLNTRSLITGDYSGRVWPLLGLRAGGMILIKIIVFLLFGFKTKKVGWGFCSPNF